MENNLKDIGSEFFSQLLLRQELPSLSQIKPLNNAANNGIGPFITDGEAYCFDLRSIAEKGSLSHAHPLFFKSLIETCLNSSSYKSQFDFNISDYPLIESLNIDDKEISFVESINKDVDIFKLDNFVNKNKTSSNTVLIQDLLFTSKENLIPTEILKDLNANEIYIDLGIGSFLVISEKKIESNLSSFQQNLLPIFFKFYNYVLINNGKGRISEIEKTLSSSGIETFGCHCLVKKDKLNNKPIEHSHIQINDAYYLNIPTSINDDMLFKLIEIINE